MSPPRNCVYANPLRACLWAAPIVVLALSVVWHWLYDWCPVSAIGLVAPVAESVWEHGKIVWYPCLVYAAGCAVVCRKQCPARIVLLSGVVMALTAVGAMFALYYIVHAALGVGEALWVDILAEWSALCSAAGANAYCIRNLPMGKHTLRVGIAAILVVSALFGVCSFWVPNAPVFARL